MHAPAVDHTWPARRIHGAPRWLSTDLREGNHGHMSAGHKLKVFELLARMNCPEIEVGCPAASRDHFDFVRKLIDEDRIPAGVVISVLAPARSCLVGRTVASLRGAAHAIIHLCDAGRASPGEAFTPSDAAAVSRLVACAGDVLSAVGSQPVALEYSLEFVSGMELSVVAEACRRVAEVWQPGPGRELIVNVATGWKKITPSLFADHVEELDRRLASTGASRAYTCRSVHPRNRADSGVGAAELALLAGAQRVEGCLLGDGRLTQDISLAALATNLLSCGVDPDLDLPQVHAIAAAAGPSAEIAHVMRAEHGLDLPAGLQAEFAGMVRACAELSGNPVSADQMWDMFEREYLLREPASALLMRCSTRYSNLSPADPWIALFKIRHTIRAAEDNPLLIVAGTLAAMGLDVVILSRYSQLVESTDLTVVYAHCVVGSPVWGV